MAGTIELYNILKDKIGEEGSRAIVETFEEVAKESKVEYRYDLTTVKDDIKAIRRDIEKMATKEDLTAVKEDVKAMRQEMATKSDLKLLETKLDGRMRLYFIIFLFVMLLTNPKAIDLIAKILGIVK